MVASNMSGEAFETFLTADMRTAPDGRSREYAESMSQQPRFLSAKTGVRHADGWVDGYLYAEDVIRIAATTVREQPMAGISGDHADKRQHAAAILDAVANLVRILALDHACDSHVDDERWASGLASVLATVEDADNPTESSVEGNGAS